ncbi:MAG: hypothetical protein NWP69_07735, partial [Congregibacter sp.]|nr:hypothetical protein [Congregibacter sp.]
SGPHSGAGGIAGGAQSTLRVMAEFHHQGQWQSQQQVLADTPGLRFIERQVIAPSRELDRIAAENIESLPPSVRFLLRATGGTESGAGSTAASYLLFARPFVEVLIALGYGDAMEQREDIAEFLGVTAPA